MADVAPATRQRDATSSTPPRWPVRMLMVTATAMTLLVLVQAVSAGHLLSGNVTARVVHRDMVFAVITWVALTQLLAAVLIVWPGRGRAWPLLLAVVNVAAITMQIEAGFTHRLALHVPLGVSILVLNLLMALTAPALARRRTTGRRTGTDGD